MQSALSRRRLMSGAAAGALVVGFDPRSRSWISDARASGPMDEVPPLDGELTTDEGAREEAADDFGHVVSRFPIAVLRPGSVDDIAKIVLFAREHGLEVAMRGQGHSNYGQAQVEGGIVVDSRSLATIHHVGPGGAVVDAGVLWSTLLHETAARGLTPPVLVDYLDLSVGGVLSVGGIGGATQRHGVAADNVLALTVVTGRGEVVDCSPDLRPDLFDAVLAGVGQCAIIARAVVRLVPAPTSGVLFQLYYDDVQTYVEDQEMLVAEDRFEYLEGQVVADAATGAWRYMIEAVSFFSPPALPDVAGLLEGLRDDRASAQVQPTTYLSFANRIVPLVAALKAIGSWDDPHPWISLFVPASAAAAYVGELVSALTTADTGGGPILFYPVRTGRIGRPLFRLPDEPVAFAFNILRTAPPGDPEVLEAMLADNRALYDEVFALGGTRYVIGAIPDFTKEDWIEHFGPEWGRLVQARRRYDPDGVLTPGQGIFSS